MMPYLIHSILTQKQFALLNYQPACRSGRLLITNYQTLFVNKTPTAATTLLSLFISNLNPMFIWGLS